MELAEFLVKRKSFLPKPVRQYLQENFSSDSPDRVDGKEDFDLHQEVIDQIKAARFLRNQALPTDGARIDIREAKESLSAATSLLKTLTGILDKVYSQDRIRTLQQGLIETLREVDPALQRKFLSLLKERLNV